MTPTTLLLSIIALELLVLILSHDAARIEAGIRLAAQQRRCDEIDRAIDARIAQEATREPWHVKAAGGNQ